MAAASAVVDRLLRRLASYGSEVELASAVKEDMAHVKKALSRWHVVLENTEAQLFEGASGVRSKILMSKENKMAKIKHLAYDIEDILDEFEDYGRRSGGGSERTEEVLCCSSGPFSPTTTASRMKMVRKKLDRESEKSIIFSLLHHSNKPDLEINDEQGSFDINSIIGRDEDKANIKKIINDAGPFSIIPIVGLPGIGKTSLAKLIFNDRGEDCKFDHHIWINLNMSFDLGNIVNGIISQVGNKEEGTSQKNQGTVKNLVRQALTDKRSLIVLDNLWSMDMIQLDELKEMLSTVICSVIVTTSSEEVAKLFNTVSPYKLGLLSDSDCWTIFSGVASKDQETRDHVVKLCQGMPVVAHSLSSVVQAKGKNVWKDAKNKELRHLQKLLEPKVKMFRSLKQIYYMMPPGLKSCLGYLSIFPKGFHIDAEKLIWQWSALDMLGSNHGILPPYAQGKNYIQTLLSIFYLQAPEQSSANGMVLINGKNMLEMHSLVHSFARYVSSDELVIFEDQIAPIRSEKGTTFRYALFLECNEVSTIPKGFLTKARAVSFKGCKARKLPEEALSALSYLNVLDLSGCSFLELPSSVGQLKHLRYLDVSHSGLQSLPSELRRLQNLEALDLSRNSINVPLGLIGPFEKLKYLNLQECPNLRDLLWTFGDLKGLEYLNMSGCSEVSELPETLCGFSALQLLDLSSCAELKKLPQSLGSLKNLVDLNLSGCSRLEQLPETFHELYSLKFLNLENCSMLQQLPHLFGNLKTLEILNLSGCTSLQELPKSFGDLYFLRVLSLDSCFGLRESPKVLGNLLNLESLNLAHISLELPEALINLRRLHTLDLTGCDFKKSFADIVNKVTNLKFVLTDDSRLALSVSRHILISTENKKQLCVDSHVIQSRDLELAGIVGETDADEIVESLETGMGTTDKANLQQETRSSFELIVGDKDLSASKDIEFSAGTQDHMPMRPRLRRSNNTLLCCSVPYAMGNCFGSPADAAAKPPGPTKVTRPKASDSGGSGTQEKGDGPGPGGLVLEVPRLRVFTFAELRAATRCFRPETVLREGGFGQVYKGWVDERTLNPARSNAGVLVAVKKLNPEGVQGLQEWQTLINMLGRLSHPNLVRLLGYCIEDRELLLVHEFMSKGSLEDHLFKRGGNLLEVLSWSRRLKIAMGAACGLAFLHSLKEQVIYRDFKASNILLDSDFTAKLSDFGLAINGPPAGELYFETQVMGTYGYAAPEYIATGHLYVKSDVYSFGVVLLEMLTGLRVLDTGRPAQQHNLVEWAKPYLVDRRKLVRLVDPRLEGQYPAKAAIQAAQLTLRCLVGDPRSRPSMEEVVLALEEIGQIKVRLKGAARDQDEKRRGAGTSTAAGDRRLHGPAMGGKQQPITTHLRV